MLEQGTVEMTCNHCAAVHVVEYTDYPEKDRYSLNCEKCGEILLQGKGTRDFQRAKLKNT